MVELTAAYSPPMPPPVRKRNRKKLAAFQERPGQRRRNEIDRDGDEEQLPAAETIGQPAEEERAETAPSEIGAAGEADVGVAKASVGLAFKAPGTEPASVTSRPSSIQVMPSATTTST